MMIKLYLKHFRKIKTKRLPFLNFLCIFVTRKEEFVPAPFQLRQLSVSARVAGSRCRRWSTTRNTSPGSANGSRLRSPRPLSSQLSMETPNHHTRVLLIHLHLSIQPLKISIYIDRFPNKLCDFPQNLYKAACIITFLFGVKALTESFILLF